MNTYTPLTILNSNVHQCNNSSQKKNIKTYFPNFDYIRKLFESKKLDKPMKVVKGSKQPSELVVNGNSFLQRIKSSCQTYPLLIESEPSSKKKEIEVIFSERKFIHGQRSQSVYSLAPNMDNGVIRKSITNISAHMLHPTTQCSEGGCKPPLPSDKFVINLCDVANEESVFSIYDPTAEFSSQKIKCKNIDVRLAEEVGITNYNKMDEIEESEKWVPPSLHGIGNSERIIPIHYLPSNMCKRNILRVDYHYMVLDDIRNLRPLNDNQLGYIKNSLNESEKQKVIEEFNNVIKSYGEVLLGDHD